MFLVAPNAFPVTSQEQWFERWPPKRGMAQWVNGQSAKELARAWFPESGGPRIPPAFYRLLASSPLLDALVIEEAFGERVVPLDTFGGETRNTDLVLRGQCAGGGVLVQVEAKADELFASGKTVRDAWRAGHGRKGSNVPHRIRNLCGLLFPHQKVPQDAADLPPALANLSYQLLYSAAATLLDARSFDTSVAVFVVHELLPSSESHCFTDASGNPRKPLNWKQIARNRTQFGEFLSAFVPGSSTKSETLLDAGTFYPPSSLDWIPARGERPIRLLIGKATDATA